MVGPLRWRGSDTTTVPESARPSLRGVLPRQPVLERVERRPGPGGDADLGVDPLEVAVYRLRADGRRPGDLAHRPAARALAEDLDLARGQPLRPRPWRRGAGHRHD